MQVPSTPIATGLLPTTLLDQRRNPAEITGKGLFLPDRSDRPNVETIAICHLGMRVF
jgi:hypothetical protein